MKKISLKNFTTVKSLAISVMNLELKKGPYLIWMNQENQIILMSKKSSNRQKWAIKRWINRLQGSRINLLIKKVK